MTLRRALLPVAAATTLLGMLLTPAPAFAAGGTVYVDDGWAGTAPGADPDDAGPATAFGTDAFATVIDAVASTPDRIQVAAGDYVGQLVLDADVEIVGAGEGSTFLTAPAAPGDYTSYWGQNGIVVVTGAQVVMSGVTIRGPQPGVPMMVGALIVDGGVLELTASTVRSIRDDPVSGAQRGVAVVAGVSGGATTGTVTLRDVLLTDYQKLGVVIRQGSTATIEDSVVQGRGTQCVLASNGIQLQGTATVRRTQVLDNRYADTVGTPGCGSGPAEASGIRVSWPTGPTVLEDNTITGTEVAISLSSDPGAGAPLTIRGNTIVGLEGDPTGNPLADESWGIYSEWARDGAAISDNTITRTREALHLAGGAEDVTSNSLRDNATAVVLDATPLRFAANSIVGNTAGLSASASTTGGPNWWGCDEGPGATGCDSGDPDYTEANWLVLSLTLDACQVTEGTSIAAVARLTTTSAGTPYTAATVPATQITLHGDARLTPSPASGVTVAGELPVTLRGVAPGAATVEADADNGVAMAPGAGGCARLMVLAGPARELAATGADTQQTPWGAGMLAAGALLVALAARARRRRRESDYARGDV